MHCLHRYSFLLNFGLCAIAHADPSAPADFTIGTQVVRTAPERLGVNMAYPVLNNFLRDSGGEPVNIRRQWVATGGSDTTILVQPGATPNLSFFATLADGFFDGASVRVYRSTGGVMQAVRTGIVQDYSVTTGAITFTQAGPPVQNGDLFFLEFLAATNPPFDHFDPRITAIYYDTWRHMNGDNTSATSLAQPAVTRDTTTMCPENGGRSSIRIVNGESQRVGIRQGRWHNPDPRITTTGGFYEALEPGRQYRIDVWLKHSGLTNPQVSARLTGPYALERGWAVTNDWVKYTATFIGPAVPPVAAPVIEAELGFSGVGTVWMDNFQIYADDDGDPATDGAEGVLPEARAALVDMQPGTLRIWSGVTNERWGTSLDSFTQTESAQMLSWTADRGLRYPEFPLTLPTALPLCVESGAQPWLVIGHTFDENEWLGLIEYLAAPYDPLVDTPATKPWAARRHAQGRTAPWTDAFTRVRLEMSNEMWNSFFQQQMPAITAGQFSQLMFAAAQSSPYFAAVATKVDFIVNGRILETTTNGYGHIAWQNTPAAPFSDIATYNGGWELARQTGGGVFNADGLGEFLQFSGRFMFPWLEAHAATRTTLRTQTGRLYDVMVYETGPGYGLPTAGTVFNEVAEQYGKSLAAGVGTLDIMLYSSLRGFDPQCFYSFAFASNWSSHGHRFFGSLPHTAWQAMRLRNRLASGDMMSVATHSLPTDTLAPIPGTQTIPGVENFPLITCYAFRDGNHTTIFCCSRKVTGDTPVTLRLPFSSVSSAVMHRLDGAPGDNNRYALNVMEVSSPLTPSPMLQFTLAPGTVVAVVVEGTPLSAPAQPACIVSRAVGQSSTTAAPTARFAVDFSESVSGFTAADCVLSGTAGAAAAVVTQGVPFFGGNYIVTVSNLQQAGTIVLSVPASAVTAVSGGAVNTPSTGMDAVVTYTPALPQDILYAQDNFDFAPAEQPFPPFLAQVVSGSGWGAPWLVQGFNVNYPAQGFRTTDSNPLSYADLRVTGVHGIGGANGTDLTRELNPPSFGYRAVSGSNPLVIGQSSTVLWISALLRKETTDGNGIYLALHNGAPGGTITGGGAAMGYFNGGISDAAGQRWWSMSALNAAGNGFDIRSNVPVVVGESALLVLRLQFGAQDRLDLWVNPAPSTLAGPEPALATANATWTTTGASNITFRTLGMDISGDFNRGSFDEIRLGETWAAVTPVWTPSEGWRIDHFGSHQNSALAADTADPDFDGLTNLLEYALTSNPNEPSSASLPALDASGQFHYTANPLATDITITPQWSEDLLVWFNTSPPAGVSRLFRRLQITRP